MEMSTMSLVNNPELYETVLEAAMNLIKSGYTPVRILPVNSYLYRSSPYLSGESDETAASR
jgi:hypothetical protein